ncbi:hypothetical protein K8R62_01820 [bacterium]|nr:hypothetical protein [bacterium]
MKNSLFLLVVIIIFSLQSVTAEAVSEKFIMKYINQNVEIGYKPNNISLSGLISKVERIVMLEYDETENLCLIEIRYRAGMGREGLAVQIKKYWVSPDVIAFPELH